MNKTTLQKRTKDFAIDIGKLTIELPYNTINKNYSNQLIRCSSSVGANYRAACRAKSLPDFINKLKIVEEELDESLFFLELLAEFNIDFKENIRTNYSEGNELLAIIVASINTAKNRKSKIVNLKS